MCVVRDLKVRLGANKVGTQKEKGKPNFKSMYTRLHGLPMLGT